MIAAAGCVRYLNQWYLLGNLFGWREHTFPRLPITRDD